MKSEPFFLASFAVSEVQSFLDAGANFQVPRLPKREPRKRQSDIAIVEVMGPTARRQTWLSELLGWATYERIIRQLEEAAADDSINAVVLLIDSPGGIASGCLECAEAVAKAAKSKPVIAVIDGVGASAAYFLASAATKIIAAPDSWVGSVGTVFELKSFAELEKRVGIQTTLVTTGEFKAAGHPSEPMTEPVKQYFAGLIDQMGQFFTDHVSKYRKLTPEQSAEIQTAKVFTAADAQRIGLIDGVGFTRDVLDALLNRPFDDSRGVMQSLFPIGQELKSYRAFQSRESNGNDLATFEFWEAVDTAQDQKNCTRAEAMRFVAQQDPTKFSAFAS